MGIEIERKWLLKRVPSNLSDYPYREIEQAYLNFSPAIRVRHSAQDGEDSYSMTYKGGGLFSHREDNLPIDAATYFHLRGKHDGVLVVKRRYMIPYKNYLIELDVFHGELEGLLLAEVEFPNEEEERTFSGPDWFGEDVTNTGLYSNARLAFHGLPEAAAGGFGM